MIDHILTKYRSESPAQDCANFQADRESIAQIHSVLIDSVIMKMNCMMLMGGSTNNLENFIGEN